MKQGGVNMATVKWIKILTDIFDDEKILLIESMPEADAIIVIWFKLLCLAGKQNNSGVFMLNDKIPYTDEMFATIFRRKPAIVKLALQTFEQFGMIEVINNTVTIPNWEKHQQLDALERSREATRKRVADYRQKQKALTTGSVTCNVTDGVTVTPCNADRIEGEEDKSSSSGARAREDATATAENAFSDGDGARPNFDTVEIYATNELKTMTAGNMQELASFKRDLPEALIKHAIDEAGAAGARTWSYVRRILNRYVEDGIKTVGDAKAQEESRGARGARSSPKVSAAEESNAFWGKVKWS